jgi:fructokinase
MNYGSGIMKTDLKSSIKHCTSHIAHPISHIPSSDRTVYCIGETVLDIIFNNDQPVAAKPGGSMLNTAVSLGRAGIRVEFISEIATDRPGEMIVRFLQENNVGTTYINRYTEGKTTLSLAFLNKQADAGYSFYADLPKERLTRKHPVPTGEDIILFGSFFSLADGIHEKVTAILSAAKQNNALIIYDPNFRQPHLNELSRVMPRIMENISYANIIRGSDEDFLHIFNAREPCDAYARIRTRDNQVLIYTRSNEAVSILTGKQEISVAVPKIKPVSTIGAGDSFNAGLIYGLIAMGITCEKIPIISAADWKLIAGNAIRFSQNVCMSLDNYISYDFLISLER